MFICYSLKCDDKSKYDFVCKIMFWREFQLAYQQWLNHIIFKGVITKKKIQSV